MKYRTKLLLAFIALALVASVPLYLLSSHLAGRSLFEQIQNTVRSIAIAAAHEVDGDQHQQIRGEDVANSAAYQQAIQHLRGIRDAHRSEQTDIAFIYTFRPSDEDSSKWIYVLDAEEEEADRSFFGDPFIFEARDARDLDFQLEAPAKADLDFTSDQYGTFLSAHAPIRNRAGEVVARLGVDFNASDVRAIQHRTAGRSLLGLAIALAIGVIFSLILSTWAELPLRGITRTLQDIGDGKLDSRIASTRTDEFGLVERAVDSMAASLQEKSELRGALSRYVARDVAQDVVHVPGEAESEVGSTKKRITVLFCDIDEFEKLSPDQPSGQVIDTLNAFFSNTIATIFENGGTFDRFHGAGIMATFGTLDEECPHENLALKTAVKMREAFRSMSGSDRVALRIGIHTGESSVSESDHHPKMSYKAVGGAVDGAARVVAESRHQKLDILATTDTLAGAVDEFRCEPAGELDDEEPVLSLVHVLS